MCLKILPVMYIHKFCVFSLGNRRQTLAICYCIEIHVKVLWQYNVLSHPTAVSYSCWLSIRWLTNNKKLLPIIWVANKVNFIIQTFPLFRWSLFRSPLYSFYLFLKCQTSVLLPRKFKSVLFEFSSIHSGSCTDGITIYRAIVPCLYCIRF